MKAGLFGFVLILGTSLTAQWRFSLTYFHDTTYFNGGKAHSYDATDIFYGWDEFVRLNFAYELSEKNRVDGWVDLQSSFEPTNFKLGYQHWFNEYFYAELAGMKQGLFTSQYEEDFSESGVDQYFNLYQYGAGVGVRKPLKFLELSTAVHFYKGVSEHAQFDELFRSDFNLRTLITQDYQMENLYSINVEAGFTIRLFERGNFSGGLMYKFVWRGDRFNYANDVRVYEWTASNEVSSTVYNTRHVFDHVQHQVGVIVLKK